LLDAILNVLSPVRCVLCSKLVREWRSGALCTDCEGNLRPQRPPWCPRCGLPAPRIDSLCGHCLEGRTQFDFGRAALVLDPELRRVIHHFKYHDRVSLARPLGRALLGCLRTEDFTAELVIPVPLHPRRERKRGYNQATLLAARLGKEVGNNVVRRRKNTATQTGLTRRQRALNVRGAFQCRRRIEGCVLIVDDVQTTGATVNALAHTLRRGGASRIEVLTLTRVWNQD
jgi:ComF family protein